MSREQRQSTLPKAALKAPAARKLSLDRRPASGRGIAPEQSLDSYAIASLDLQ
jgi:hypothetical protein